MFSSIEEVGDGLRMAGYLTDEIAAAVIYVAARLHKPLLLEGPAGSGKTQLPYAIAETRSGNPPVTVTGDPGATSWRSSKL